MKDEVKTENHPAYGLVSISRASGHTALFDSPIHHHHFIRLTISTATLHRNLHRNWFHPIDELIEINMSEAQFAQAITSMNTVGTPCTLFRYIDPYTKGWTRPKLELANPEHDTYEHEIKAALKDIVSLVKDTINQLDTALKKTPVRKTDMHVVKDSLTKILQDLADNLPFIQCSFVETMEKVTQKVKTEIFATAEAVIRERGLNSIKDLIGTDSKTNLLKSPSTINVDDDDYDPRG